MVITIGKGVEGKKLVHDKVKEAQVEVPDGWLTIPLTCAEGEVKATGSVRIRKGDVVSSVAQRHFQELFTKLAQKAVTAETKNA